MKKKLIVVFLICSSFLFCYPIKSFDSHNPSNTPSAKIASLGGMQVAYSDDAFFNIYNPALLVFNKNNKMGLSFKYWANTPKANVKKPSQVLKKSSLNALNVTSTQNFALFYRPIAEEKKEFKNSLTNYSFDYYLSSLGTSFAEKYQNYSVGFNIQYLFGRLVYNQTNFEENKTVSNEFLDSKLNGFSTDLAFAYNHQGFTSGLVFYDLISGIYKEKAGYSKLKQRYNYGASYQYESSKMLAGISSTMRLSDKKIYHFGYQQKLADFNANVSNLNFRVGMWGPHFKSSKQLFTGYGTSITYQSITIDFSVINNNWEFRKNRYYLSFSFNAE